VPHSRQPFWLVKIIREIVLAIVFLDCVKGRMKLTEALGTVAAIIGAWLFIMICAVMYPREAWRLIRGH
jgi:hypothetical protein